MGQTFNGRLYYRQTFNLTCSITDLLYYREYYRLLENTRHNWLPMLPTNDLASQDSAYLKIQTSTILTKPPQQHLLTCPSVGTILVHLLTCQLAETCLNNNPNFANPFLEEMIPIPITGVAPAG